MTQIPLRCPTCGPMILVREETEPTVYRFCPVCGERKLFWDSEAETLKIVGEQWPPDRGEDE